ncbi:MAG: flagellar hook-length control protein FliK [Proteobacteria bacterium]|nr:flagellar hook-length control protein FliK [Pseudomonadota bacterium]
MNDFGQMLMTGGSSSFFGSPIAGPLSQGANLPGLSEPEEGFVDLLSMVEDMSIPDAQSGNLEEIVSHEVESQKDSELLKLKQQWGSGVMLDSASFLNKTSIEDSNPLKNENSNILSNKPVDVSSLNLDLLSNPRSLSSSANQESLKVESWTLALQNGDIKSIVVEKAKVSPGEQAILNQARVSSLSSDFTKPMESASGIALSGEILPSEASDKKLLRKGDESKDGFSALNTKGLERVKSSIDDRNLSSPLSHSSLQADSKNSNVENLKGSFSGHAKAKNSVQSGADFLLEQSPASAAGVSAAALSLKAGDLLKDKSAVGTSGDKRISSDAINFVSHHVDLLKASGGGQMKIDLHPSELGSIEITVKKDGKSMSVDIKVEKPETLKMLSEQKDILSQTLNRQTKTSITFEAKHSNSLSNFSDTSLNENISTLDMSKHHKVETSADRLDFMTHSVSDSVDISTGSGKEFSSSSNNSGHNPERQSTMLMGESFDREGSREEAMAKWEKLWKEKQSA